MKWKVIIIIIKFIFFHQFLKEFFKIISHRQLECLYFAIIYLSHSKFAFS